MKERLVSADIARYKIVRKDWFAYNPMRLNIGSIARWQGEGEILVSPDYVVFKCLDDTDSGIASVYLDHFRQTDAWRDFVSDGGDGSVRVRIYYKDIARLLLVLPRVQEQKKIVDCLTSLDDVIAAQAQKVAALKAHKQGLMQQLFPCEGETVPRLRFPEFRGEPAWEALALADLARLSSGSTPPRSQPELFENGTIPWVKTGDLSNSFIDDTEERITPRARATINPVGSVLVAMYGGLKQIGRTGLLRIPAATNQALSVLSVNQQRASPLYVLSWLNARVDQWKRIAGSSRKDPNITSVDVAQFPILVPSKREQERIADCLSSLDEQVAAESELLETLRAHKAGLMQQVFPPPTAPA